MTETMLMLQVERLVVNGHIPLPSTLTEVAAFLGSHDTSGLSRKGTEER